MCFSTKIVYEFRVFSILLTSSDYEDFKISLPWQNPCINAKRNSVHPVLCFSFAFHNVLGSSIFRVYHDNSPLLHIMYNSLPQTIFWRYNYRCGLDVVCRECHMQCLSWVTFHCFSILIAVNNPCKLIGFLPIIHWIYIQDVTCLRFWA
jgi:hypothetical protein